MLIGTANVSNGASIATQEQLKLQKYKEDSISILKQLQESGSIVIADVMEPSNNNKDAIASKKHSVDSK